MTERTARSYEVRIDRGAATPIEMMFLLIAGLVALALLAWVGRLHSAAIEVESAARAAARAASLAATSDDAPAAADEVVSRSSLVDRCAPPSVSTSWSPSQLGTWQGASVTVRVRCHLASSLLDRWAPGDRVIEAVDTEVVDRYRR
jgi:Flp pilus assembly protein TadG